MPNSTLDPDGQKRLAKVLGIADGNSDLIPYAVRVALSDIHERARRVYLRNELARRARNRIRALQRKAKPKAKSKSVFAFKITPAMRFDAWRHEQELCRGIPEDDR